MKISKRIIAVMLSIMILATSLVFSASAVEVDFSMEKLDKGYITIIFDDGNLPFTQDMADLFEEFEMPMSAATIANKVEKGGDLYNALVQVQENGGEILSHGYNHYPITSQEVAEEEKEKERIYTKEDIEKELRDSWIHLNRLGFDVNGMIQVGGGGNTVEGTADFELVEKVARKYYKYSDKSGTSAQYDLTAVNGVAAVNADHGGRRCMSNDTLARIKQRVNEAATNKEWLVLYAHNYGEISSDQASKDDTTMREILQYIKDKNGAVEVVTWKTMYENFGEYRGPQVPTQEALEELKPTNYYVGYNGTGDGSSLEKMAPTVAAAVNTINNNGLGEGDIANIHIVQEGSQITITGQELTANPNHNLAHLGSTIPEHTATINICAYSENKTEGGEKLADTYLAFSSGVNYQSELELKGPTRIDDVTLLYMTSSNIDSKGINLNGKNFEITGNTKFAYLNVNTQSVYAEGETEDETLVGKKYSEVGWPADITAKKKSLNYMTTSMGKSGVKYTDSVSAVYGFLNNGGRPAQRLNIVSNNGATFDGDVNVELKGSHNITYFRFGGDTNKESYINGNLNLKFVPQGDKNIRLLDYTSTLNIGGAVQVIDNGVTFPKYENASKTSIAELTKLVNSDGTAKPDMWYLNVPNGSEYIEFVEGQKGVFKILDGAEAIATPKDGGAAIVSEGDTLTLPVAGEYDIQIKIKLYDYYVKYGETGNGTSPKSPAGTVSAAITTMNELGNLSAEDTAEIHIMQDAENIICNSDRKHNLARWGDYVEYEAKIVLKAYDDNSYNGKLTNAMIATSSQMGTQGTIKLGGPTEFQNVCIFVPYYVYSKVTNTSLNLNAQDVKINNITKFAYFNGKSDTYSNWTDVDFYEKGTIKDVGLVQTYITSGTNGAKISKKVNVTIDKGFSTTAWGGSFLAIGDSTDIFNEDVTVNLNISTNSNEPRVYIGNTNGATFNKNLNIKLTEGKNFGFNPNKTITVNGGLQFIYSDSVSYNTKKPYNNVDDKAQKSDGTAADSWIIKVSSADIEGVSFTDETGKFKAVKQDLVALATRTDVENAEPVGADSNGIIDLSDAPGEYTISFVDDYTNDYEKIVVYKDVELDLSTVRHLDIDNKLFMGWKYEDTDDYPQATDGKISLKAGETLVATYIDISADAFVLEDVELRYEGEGKNPAIRYILSKNNEFYDEIEATEYGAIYLPADTANGLEIFLDKEQSLSWYAYDGENNKAWDTFKETGRKPYQVKASEDKVLAETETHLKYSVCLTGIEDYRTFYTLRGYIKFTDYNNLPSAVYTAQEVSSLYKEACDIDDTPIEERTELHNEIISKAEQLNSDDYDEMMTSLVMPWQHQDDKKMLVNGTYYGAEYADELKDNNNMVYRTSKYGVVYVRPITVKTGFDVESDEMLFLTDTHVTYISEKDINKRYVNALKYYKNRAWSVDLSLDVTNKLEPSRANYSGISIDLARFASLYDKVVLGGDMADFVSDGNYQAIKRIWADRSINNGKSLKGSISMTPGNHEFSQANAAEGEKLTTEKMHQELDKVMFSGKKSGIEGLPEGNSYIDYDIIYKDDTKDGTKTPNYMIITIDNSNKVYHKEQIDPLKKYIEYAKGKMPIIIFQHVPMATNNEADKEIWYRADVGQYIIGGATKPTNTTDWATANMYNGSDMAGYTVVDGNATETTETIYNLITNNADTIKAVFCGHNHANYDTQIKAKNSDGTDATIPQYTVLNGYGRGATVIKVEK